MNIDKDIDRIYEGISIWIRSCAQNGMSLSDFSKKFDKFRKVRNTADNKNINNEAPFPVGTK